MLSKIQFTENRDDRPRYYDDSDRYRRDISRGRSSTSSRPSRKQRAWPPSPSVEDECDSLAKEAAIGNTSGDESNDEACMRGSLNQEPIMVEVQRNDRAKNIIRTPSTGSEKSKTLSDASGSDSEASRRGRPKVARIADQANKVPEIAQRRPSPYAFAQDPPKPSNRYSGEYLLSPESILSPKTPRSLGIQADHGIPTPTSTPTRPTLSRAASASQASLNSARRLGSDNAIDEAEINDAEPVGAKDQTKSSRYSFVKADLDKKEPRVKFSEGEDSDSQTLKFDPRDRPSSIRRLTDTASTLPHATFDAKGSRPSPLQTSFAYESEPKKSRPSPLKISLAEDVDQAFQRKNNEKRDSAYGPGTKRQSTRAVSPTASHAAILTPPESPRVKVSSHDVDSPIKKSHSRSESVRNSTKVPSSTSPLLTIYNDTSSRNTFTKVADSPEQYDLNSPTSKEKKSTQSRPSSSIRSDSLPTVPLPKKPSSVSTVLPYPDDNLMPNFEDHILSPNLSRSKTHTYVSRPKSPPSEHAEIHQSHKDDSTRPRLHSRHHTCTGDVHQSKDSTRRSVSDNTEKSSQTEKTLLPPCPRADHSTKYTDWYTLENCQEIDICPDCLDKVFLPSKFGKYFKKAPPRRAGKPRKCDFSSPWMRLAWLLSVQEKRSNLDLFVALSDVASNERSCSGEKEETRSWYSLKDDTKIHVPRFHVCSNCVSCVEALLPSLRGSFTRIHQTEPRVPHVCDFQTRNKHFASYLDTLVEIDTRARLDHRAPDLRPLVSLVKKTNERPVPACTRDNLHLGHRWYIIPQLPEFTVCESCYHQAVYPAIKAGHPIASKFNLKMQTVRETSLGTSCQLYSSRMRAVFRQATERNDWALLAQEARDRKAMEMHLQGKHRALRAHAEDAGRRNQGSKDDPKVKRELERMAEQWKLWE